MKLLLDTHVILWGAGEPGRLPETIRRALENDRNELWFSPISIWEILLLAEKGRIAVTPDPERFVRDLLARLPLREAPLNHEVAIQSRRLQLPHQDPADRFLAATAVVFGLALVTLDSRLLHASDLPLFPLSA